MILWGHKTIAMFDLWTLQHMASGICMAFVATIIIAKVFKKIDISPSSQKIICFFMVIAASLIWECAEHYLESGVIRGEIGAKITFWFQGVEHWSNRIIGDTIAIILGWRIYYWKKNLAIPAKLFSLLWMAAHIFIFPDSMYLQRLITR